jgi:hypothetical protein
MLIQDALKTGLPFRLPADESYLVVDSDGFVVSESHPGAAVSFHASDFSSAEWLVRLSDGHETATPPVTEAAS